jgi:hypothetical protein
LYRSIAANNKVFNLERTVRIGSHRLPEPHIRLVAFIPGSVRCRLHSFHHAVFSNKVNEGVGVLLERCNKSVYYLGGSGSDSGVNKGFVFAIVFLP